MLNLKLLYFFIQHKTKNENALKQHRKKIIQNYPYGICNRNEEYAALTQYL